MLSPSPPDKRHFAARQDTSFGPRERLMVGIWCRGLALFSRSSFRLKESASQVPYDCVLPLCSTARFIKFNQPSEASKAQEALNGVDVMGQRMGLSKAASR